MPPKDIKWALKEIKGYDEIKTAVKKMQVLHNYMVNFVSGEVMFCVKCKKYRVGKFCNKCGTVLNTPPIKEI